ncbi:MAG: Serine/threonine-protein kinase tel1 [Peltula sp. TS41687]|nr:MAG: Serine/threonine-protein kinase tel1 [Peltula sp. TS41687]
MTEVTINSAVEKILSRPVKEREKGLKELGNIFTQKKAGSGIDQLQEKHFSWIFNALFQSTWADKKPKPGKSKNEADARLGLCAKALREAVGAGSKRLRKKTTIEALVKHITQTLFESDESFCEPLCLEYAKALTALLEFQPHVEHLTADTWQALVDTCCQGINFYQDGSSESDLAMANGAAGGSIRRQRHKETASQAMSRNSKIAIDELVLSLQCLISAAKAPVLQKAEVIVPTLLTFLRNTDAVARAHPAAVAAMNVMFSKVAINFTSLTEQTILQIPSVLRKWWTTKSALLKTEMLATMIQIQTCLEKMAGKSDNDGFKTSLEKLLEIMQTEYSNRSQNDQLQLDDIGILSKMKPATRAALRTSTIYLRRGDSRAEQSWAIPESMAFLIFILRPNTSPQNEHMNGEGGDGPNKRRRVSTHLEDLVRQLNAQEVTSKLVMGDNGTGLLYSPAYGIRSWSFCRLAAHLAYCLTQCDYLCDLSSRMPPYGDDIGVRPDLNAPALATDSALSFWILFMDIRNTANPSASSAMSERVLYWFLSKWTPANVTDRFYVAQNSIHAQPTLMLNLLLTCTGHPRINAQSESITSADVLSQARILHLQNEKLIRYLLLLNDVEERRVVKTSKSETEVEPDAPGAGRYPQLQMQTVEFCILEFDRARENWTSFFSEQPIKMNSDMVRTLASLCIVGAVLLGRFNNSETASRATRLSKSVEALTSILAAFLSRTECDPNHVDIALEMVSPFLPPVRDLSRFRNEVGLTMLFDRIAEMLHSRQQSMKDPWIQQSAEYMDVDDDFGSQQSRKRSEATDFPRHDLAASVHISSFRYSVSARLYLLHEASQIPPHVHSETPQHLSLMRYISSLTQSNLMACRDILTEVTSEGGWSRHDANALLLHLGKNLLEKYEYDWCETALCLYLDVLAGFVELWSQDIVDDLHDTASTLYRWLIGKALEKGILSVKAQIRLVNLLQRLLEVQPDYAKRLVLPCVRASLLKVLQIGDISVKFYSTEQLPKIFSLSSIKEHDTIFEEVLAHLPTDSDWMEGIAIRLMILARLASSWYTVLRRGVYHIFEAPGFVPNSMEHANRCLSFVSRSLHLKQPSDLLKLFLSQILYTWLQSQTLHSIPYSIFGYSTLRDLLTDVRQEAVGQLVMQGKEDEVQKLAEATGITYERLLVESFDKAIAYSIARDISLPPVPSPTENIGGEVRIRKRLGKETFAISIRDNFAQILALFFKCAEEEQQIERAFTEQPQFAYAAKTLKVIKGFDAADNALPPSQQPSFRARYLIDEIEHLCRRAKFDAVDAVTLWNPALFAFVARKLLNEIHPALGPLHACSVIRRIRILVCLGGDAALQDYPLEMLLHSLRNFLTEPHCAEDTIGLLRYLFEAARTYLAQVPSFLAGISVSILPSLQAFLDSLQERMSKDELLAITYSKAQAFHKWFKSYLELYNPPSMSGKPAVALKTILRSACCIRAHGSAYIGTNESDMLRELLADERSISKLLNHPSRSLAFSLLCAEFPRPPPYRDDMLGSDASSCANAVTIWRSCQRSDVGKNYLLWAGRILGRAYAASGSVPADLLAESDFQNLEDLSRGSFSTEFGSRAAILRILCNLLLSNEQADVSLAEMTLQMTALRLFGVPEAADYEQVIPGPFLTTIVWQRIPPPDFKLPPPVKVSVRQSGSRTGNPPLVDWIRDLCIAMAYSAEDDPLIGMLPPILSRIAGLAEQIFPFILHIVLLREFGQAEGIRRDVSGIFRGWLQGCDDSTIAHNKAILAAILYLRGQPIPQEASKADRDRWLELDYLEAAQAATKCRMFKSSLLCAEIHSSEATPDSSHPPAPIPTDLLLEIFKHIEEPDSFYGVEQEASLSSIMDRLDYEKDGFKSLSFRGADYDSQLRCNAEDTGQDPAGLIRALNHLNLSGLTLSLLQNQPTHRSTIGESEIMYRSARGLDQWNLPVPGLQKSEETAIYRAFQCINTTSDLRILTEKLDNEFLQVMMQVVDRDHLVSSMRASLRTLAVLTEIDEVMTSRNSGQLREALERLNTRNAWMRIGRVEDAIQILLSRETLFSAMVRQSYLRDLVQSDIREIRAMEIRSVVESSRMSRNHEALQSALKSAMYLSNLIEPSRRLGIEIEAVARFEAAGVLWDQGEMTASIRMLQRLRGALDPSQQTMRIGSAELLAKLGRQVSEARMEKPEEIISRYLQPAIKELKGASEGNEAGEVFHEFASFCDRQLQDAGNLEEFQRMQGLRQRKEAEIHGLQSMMSSGGSESKAKLQDLESATKKAKQWFNLDDREYQRLRESRQSFLRQSLENYLRSLRACDTFDTDVLRFCALWFEHSDSEIGNSAVSIHLPGVPSRKFAPLMNQLSSRLSDVQDKFQSLLFPLILRICTDHPYHGMYQIFSTSKSGDKDKEKGREKDKDKSRYAAASKVAALLKKNKSTSGKWQAIFNTNMYYTRLAMERLNDRPKTGGGLPLRKLQSGQRFEKDIVANRIPPPTMKIQVRPDCDYSSLPVVARYLPSFYIEGGVSAPKIITAIGSDGLEYKQVVGDFTGLQGYNVWLTYRSQVKGGNDDLRQDAIMEQVFEHVSDLLQHDRTTRPRNLTIRTYKVIPLSTTAGILEFVPNTIALQKYLESAHPNYHPKDWSFNNCRKQIIKYENHNIKDRLAAYRQVTKNFHPALRYFFMERFYNPDDWFEKRLAYSRSTAAISILGHVLGLGDRHGQNILLDKNTGEVVHIDLGIAFEQGRVLPVPEVVPFRLTRDVVDAMGITKTEGVFRRCCEFTLEALRKESYSIMTVLDVLRYDPLYSWTISPLRMRKMQEQSHEKDVPHSSPSDVIAGTSARSKDVNEPSEADRALTVVAKKLSKTLSVTATVNELIQQATDERNLAVLYFGWAAWA